MIEDSELRRRLATITQENPASRPGSSLTESAKRGTQEFDDLMEDFVSGYVEGQYPGLTGYAYQADMVSIERGREIMDELLDDIVEIRYVGDAHPEFRLKGEDNWRSSVDTEDFPQPSADEEGEDEEEGEEEEEEEESGGCFEDCKCPDSCDCKPCDECDDGKVCCCPCTV